MIVVCRIAVESSNSHAKPFAAAASGEAKPPHLLGKSPAAYETEASANATPPRKPENHMTNMYVPLIGFGTSLSMRLALTSHEPRKICVRPRKHAPSATEMSCEMTAASRPASLTSVQVRDRDQGAIRLRRNREPIAHRPIDVLENREGDEGHTKLFGWDANGY